MKIKEDGESGVPLNTTADIKGPVLPIKISSVVRRKDLYKAAKLKSKKLVQEQMGINADILFCEDSAVFLNQ